MPENVESRGDKQPFTRQAQIFGWACFAIGMIIGMILGGTLAALLTWAAIHNG